MNNNNKIWTISAQYNEANIPECKDNLLIESIPKAYDRASFMNRSSHRLIFDHEQHQFLKDDLLDKVELIETHCYYPRDEAYPTYKKLYRTIKKGYCDRNPRDIRVIQEKEKLVSDKKWISKAPKTSNSTIAIVGITATGKSSTIHSCLSAIPQLILHDNDHYKGIQLTWISISCPETKAPKALILAFFNAIDEVLGTDYFSSYVDSKHSVPSLRFEARKLVVQYNIGLIHIDEMQFITQYEHSKDISFAFIDAFIDYLGVPIIWSATSQVYAGLEENMTTLRRLYADRVFDMDPIAKGDEYWYKLVKHYEYPELLNCCFDDLFVELTRTLCAGIPGIFVRLIKLFYEMALEAGDDHVNPIEHLHETFYSQFKPLHKGLRFIEMGLTTEFNDTTQSTQLLRDIEPIDLEEFETAFNNEHRPNRISDTSMTDDIPIVEAEEVPEEDYRPTKKVRKVPSKKRKVDEQLKQQLDLPTDELLEKLSRGEF